MASPGVKPPGGWAVGAVVALVVLAVTAPLLIALAHALLPLAVVIGVVAVALRLAFFHTRRW
jgi:hypothetical protein